MTSISSFLSSVRSVILGDSLNKIEENIFSEKVNILNNSSVNAPRIVCKDWDLKQSFESIDVGQIPNQYQATNNACDDNLVNLSVKTTCETTTIEIPTKRDGSLPPYQQTKAILTWRNLHVVNVGEVS